MAAGKSGFDIIVVGSGLAGLTAALRLQRNGAQVLVIERRALPGGLCGNFEIDGWEFQRACIDFPGCVSRELRSHGLPVSFEPVRYRIHVGDHVTHLMPMAREVLALLPHLPIGLRFAWGAKGGLERSIGSLLEVHPSPEMSKFLWILGSLLSAPPSHIRFADLFEMLHPDFGVTDLGKAIGGPGRIISAMVERFSAMGGTLHLETTFRGIHCDGAQKVVDTTRGEFVGRQVIATQPRLELYPPDAVPGLHFAQMLMAVRDDFRFPHGIEKLFHMPEDIAGSMEDLFAGRTPAAFGFQMFRTLTRARDGAYPVGAYFLMPRGEISPTPERVHAIEEYLLAQADRMLPGFSRALLYKRFFSPSDFARVHEMSSALMPLMTPPKWRRPEFQDAVTQIHYTRPAIEPPNNTGAAVLSGVACAQRVQRALG